MKHSKIEAIKLRPYYHPILLFNKLLSILACTKVKTLSGKTAHRAVPLCRFDPCAAHTLTWIHPDEDQVKAFDFRAT